jgi:hypothetical protein
VSSHGQFTDANALTALLTVESLLFAALGLTAALATPGTRVRKLPTARTLGFVVASFITLVAAGGMLAWSTIYLDHWPCDIRRSLIALVLGLAILGQPLLCWVLARGLGHKP